ncbi:phosphosulfolactate synthase [Methanobacterium petrolearium]|uniref:phosphosulfolactate synthase n=1 Tax=Methanobacterium petrolearium TaxID=710190 RepID=UPI001AE1CDDD|nr:phosphosulfolactate synthase [Methanobacterium petrolearium]MBP1946148.1 phosphosulfolactate synthase [Methanobacterium petrolearium]BDZ70710.1 phosphosulfolactate synthase [Methanobacterium petrolearium]
MNAFDFLAPQRNPKTGTGITMMLDKGMGPVTLIDLLELSGRYVDLAKFGWGTSAIHSREMIQEKVEIYLSYDVNPYPGGTLFEIAYSQNKVEDFLNEADKLGFGAIEISDGTINISPEEREKYISLVKENGYLVITEVGKKDPKRDHLLSADDRVKLVNQDLESGADLVLMEAREGGKGIGLFDDHGDIKGDELEVLIEGTQVEKIIWEAPLKNQQVYFILKFGANVNLGNISPDEITALETMRLGLRGDTLGKVNLG